MADEKDKVADFLLEMVERQGVVCTTVSDGHVLIFKRDMLLKLCYEHQDSDKITIFVKRPDFKN